MSRRPISAQDPHGRPRQSRSVGISDSSTWLLLLKDRRGRPSSDASSPLVSVALLLLASVAGLLVATWNVSRPSMRVFSVDSRVVETLLEPRSRLGFFKPMSERLDGSKICLCKIPYLYVPSKLELGKSAGLDVGSAAISVVEPGDAAQSLKEVLKIVETLRKTGAAK